MKNNYNFNTKWRLKIDRKRLIKYTTFISKCHLRINSNRKNKEKISCPNNSSKWNLVIKIQHLNCRKGITPILIFILFGISVIIFVNLCSTQLSSWDKSIDISFSHLVGIPRLLPLTSFLPWKLIYLLPLTSFLPKPCYSHLLQQLKLHLLITLT